LVNDIERAFHAAMVDVYERAKREVGYNATRFKRLVAERGGVEAARQLLRSTTATEGFTALWEARRLDLSVEAQALRPEFASLFSDGELAAARRRLAAYGYSV